MFGKFSSLLSSVTGRKNSEQEKEQKTGVPDSFTLQDFVDQLDMIGKLGSLSKVAKYIPGAPKMSDEQMRQAEHEIKRFKIIINGMTPQERLNHKIIDSASKMRIAKESGVSVAEINTFLQRFEEIQHYAKLYKK